MAVARKAQKGEHEALLAEATRLQLNMANFHKASYERKRVLIEKARAGAPRPAYFGGREHSGNRSKTSERKKRDSQKEIGQVRQEPSARVRGSRTSYALLGGAALGVLGLAALAGYAANKKQSVRTEEKAAGEKRGRVWTLKETERLIHDARLRAWADWLAPGVPIMVGIQSEIEETNKWKWDILPGEVYSLNLDSEHFEVVLRGNDREITEWLTFWWMPDAGTWILDGDEYFKFEDLLGHWPHNVCTVWNDSQTSKYLADFVEGRHVMVQRYKPKRKGRHEELEGAEGGIVVAARVSKQEIDVHIGGRIYTFRVGPKEKCRLPGFEYVTSDNTLKWRIELVPSREEMTEALVAPRRLDPPGLAPIVAGYLRPSYAATPRLRRSTRLKEKAARTR